MFVGLTKLKNNSQESIKESIFMLNATFPIPRKNIFLRLLVQMEALT